jgi:hypothetical protein
MYVISKEGKSERKSNFAGRYRIHSGRSISGYPGNEVLLPFECVVKVIFCVVLLFDVARTRARTRSSS